jgi:aspartyl-tRNA(Asn)/glutamyl-tRNA(Gln) amidotransferase subunit A
MGRELSYMPAHRSAVQWAAQLAAGVFDAADAIEQTLAAIDTCDDPASSR